MRYSDINKIKERIKEDINELKEYPEVDHFIDAGFQPKLVNGEYDDNSLDLSYHYNMLKNIEADPKFMDKLTFVLNKYVHIPREIKKK